MAPVNGNVGSRPHTREGANVTFSCDSGFRPSGLRVSYCTNSTLWIPPPQDHYCEFVTGLL